MMPTKSAAKKSKRSSPSAERRFRYNVSGSVDGFIADTNGGVDWLTPYQNFDYGIASFFDQIDTIIYGRKALFPHAADGSSGTMPAVPGVDKVRNIVLSRTLKDVKGAEIARDVAVLVRELRASPGKDVWVMGGGESAAALLAAGGLDEIDLARIPVLLGTGLPLFGRLPSTVRMELVEVKSFPNAVVRERYRVVR